MIQTQINYNMRCIETRQMENILSVYFDKLQHEMYWNAFTTLCAVILDNDKLQHEMYWNDVVLSEISALYTDKLQHEMYWNEDPPPLLLLVGKDKLQHEMYWNTVWPRNNSIASLINYNMRCIETQCVVFSLNPIIDKLQHEMYWNNISLINM